MVPEAAPVGMMETTFLSHDGLRLLARHWSPKGEPKGLSVAIVHGVGEHSGRYDRLVEHLTSAGFHVHAFDLRGHGRSEGLRVHVNRWQDYRQDVAQYLKLVVEQTGGYPVFLYGHSLGVLIVLDYLIQTIPAVNLDDPSAHDRYNSHAPSVPTLHDAINRDATKNPIRAPSPSNSTGPSLDLLVGAILSGAPLQPVGVAQPLLVLAARWLSSLWPTFRLPLRVDPSALSRDEKVVADYRQDPLVEWQGTSRWGAEALATLERVRAQVRAISCPLLILHGESDRVSRAAGSRELFQGVSSDDKQLRIHPDGAHEPHNDFGYQQVLADVEQWLEEHRSAR